jgi:hypothetical protein
MPLAFFGSFFFTIVLLGATFYFLLGGLPLLVLKHDTPLDARFIRSFFGLNYTVLFFASLGAIICYAFWGRPAFALGALAIAILATVIRKSLIQIMLRLDDLIQANDCRAVDNFRRVHGLLLFLNFFLLMILLWSITHLKL